jgi:hypothetical protein
VGLFYFLRMDVSFRELSRAPEAME